MSDSAHDLLVRGIAAAKAKDKSEARFYLEWVLRDEPDADQRMEAWLWLSEISEAPAEKRDYLERVLAENMAHPVARRKLALLDAERGLELSEEKSKVTDVETGFDFLGATIRKYRGKLLMRPSRASVKGFLGSIRGTIQAHAGGALRELIRLLNPRIRGWVNYYRHLVSSRVFTKVDTAIFDAMVRWMRRQHPRKGLSWLRAKYFRSSGGRHWIITAATWKADGSVSYSDLFQASSVPIRRHVKVQQAATAFDPAYREYFQKLRKTRTQTKAADRVGSFRASATLRRSRQPRPGRVTAAPREA